jgi:pimeloyl-ACP methyl ester carboxylesterase
MTSIGILGVVAAVGAALAMDRAALFGHSRGGGAALNYALTGGDVSALDGRSADGEQSVTERRRSGERCHLRLVSVAARRYTQSA